MSSRKILIVDDDRDIRMGMGARLRANDFEVVFAEDGMGAIATARRESPDLVLLDIGLPAGNGYVVLDRMRKNTALSSIPVVVLSARDAEENEKLEKQMQRLRQEAAAKIERLNGRIRELTGSSGTSGPVQTEPDAKRGFFRR